MEISPTSLEVDSKIKGLLTLTYTANTVTTGSIMITPAGIVLEDPEDTDSTMFLRHLPQDSSKYGYVRRSSSSSKGTLTVENNVITWDRRQP